MDKHHLQMNRPAFPAAFSKTPSVLGSLLQHQNPTTHSPETSSGHPSTRRLFISSSVLNLFHYHQQIINDREPLPGFLVIQIFGDDDAEYRQNLGSAAVQMHNPCPHGDFTY